jgi:hypothetical protein
VLHGPLLYIVAGCTAFGVLGTLAVAAVPERYTWKRWLPTPLLLGVGALCIHAVALERSPRQSVLSRWYDRALAWVQTVG